MIMLGPKKVARQLAGLGIGRLAGEADRAGARPHLGLGRIAHQLADMIIGGGILVQLVELMLREIGDRQFVGARHFTRERREPSGEQLDQRRLAIAVGAKQRDAVVIVDAERHAAEHRGCRIVADGGVVDRDDRRRQQFFRRGKADLAHVLGHQRRDRLQPLQHLDAGLGLARFRGFGLEAVDEGLQAGALGFLALDGLGVEQLARGALLLEGGVSALVERELAALQMQDLVDRALQEVAVVADHDHGARIMREMILEPQRALEVEIVGGLVEQQQVGRCEQGRGQGDAHAPAAGELGAGTQLVGGGKAEAGEDRGGTAGRRMRIDVDEAGLDLGNPVRIGGALGFGEQRVALEIGLEHDGDQALRAVRGFLRQAADPPARRQAHRAVLGRELAADHLEQRRFAGAVASDQADAGAGRDLHGAAVDQKASGKADGEVGDGEHAALSPQGAANATRFSVSIKLVRVAVALLQFVQELFEMRRQARFGTETLLQPFAHGIANRAAGAPVDLFAVSGKKASHLRVPCLQSNDTVPSHCRQNGFATVGECLAF
jgi:hypothetical protein